MNANNSTEYTTKFVVSLNWKRTVEIVSHDYLEENRAILVHFETCPTSNLGSIKTFRPELNYPNSSRVLANFQYIGNFDGVNTLGGSFLDTVEVIKNVIQSMITCETDVYPPKFEILKVVR